MRFSSTYGIIPPKHTILVIKGGPHRANDETLWRLRAGSHPAPSEAYSLLLRINRGCGWNKCRFCGFYRDVPFSIRTAEDVKKDIDLVKYWVDVFQQKAVPRNPSSDADYEACSMAYHWIQSGMCSVFSRTGTAC